MSPSRPTNAAQRSILAIGLVILLALPRLAISQSPSTKQKQPAALSQAQAQFAHGDFAAAEASLWNVLGKDPQNEQALLLLGEVRLGQQRYSEAEALFRRVSQINPKSVEGHRDLARALTVEGKIPSAIEQYRAASDLAPQDVSLKIELARLYISQGQATDAAALMQGIPSAQFPKDALPIRVAALLATDKKADAALLTREAKNSPAMQLQLAEVWLGAQMPDEALQCLEIASALNPRPPRLDYLKGRALTEKGDTDAALTSLQRALSEDLKSPDTYVALAEIYSRQNKHPEAVAALQNARALNPDSLPILRHLVVEATQAANRKAAVDAASALSDKSADNPDDLYLAGAAMLQENVQGASTVLEQYASKRPNDAKGWMALGIAYVQKDQYDKARPPLERAISLDSSFAEAEYELGLVAKNQAKADEAIQHLQRAVQLQPQHVGALRTLGNLYLQSGKLAEAKETLERAEAIDSNNVQTEYDLGLTYMKLGKADLARQHMEQYRKLKEAQASSDHN